MPDFFSIIQSDFFLPKIAILIFLAGYIIFATVLFNQIKTMNKIISLSPASKILEILAILNIIFSCFLFAFALVIL